MDLHDMCFRSELDRRLSRLYADPAAAADEWVELPHDAQAAWALLGTVSSLTGHKVFVKIARCALAAHQRYLNEQTLSYALCRDTALRETFPEGEDVAYLDWAAVVIEAIRIQMGDAAFGPYLRCVIEAEDASAARHAERNAACV
ncbi:hypothetical protein [Streptomyces sp. MZ04]|uniref:hypothetical protein n=1 Tax=Streptomyces sp. MZ04 TaxID=2559236 RepID=UPI00107EC719|nr:hypothetical protein [Streptomyces sp. MZ04]TGB15487.1 hypothetical protein E2651_02345 [Streptomyces sp. MZ04]